MTGNHPVDHFLANPNDSMKITRDSVTVSKSPGLTDEVCRPKYVFTPSDIEIARRVFQLRYHTRYDAYYRLGAAEGDVISGWREGIYAAVNVHRHIDDGLAYLTRMSGHRKASISWKVDFTDTGLVVDSIQALTLSRTLNGGTVTYDIMSSDTTQDDEDETGFVANGWQSLYIIAYLTGSAESYDETQLLYQDETEDEDTFPLDILITLKPIEHFSCVCLSNQDNPAVSSDSSLDVFSPPMTEKCACYFPSESPTSAGGDARQQATTSSNWNDAVQTGSGTMQVGQSRASNNQVLGPSVVSKHRISLPGTPVHRKHYGSRSGSSKPKRRKGSSAGRVIELKVHNETSPDALQVEHVVSQTELRELAVSNLGITGSHQLTKSKVAWRARDSLFVEEDGTQERPHTGRLCKGAMCDIL